MHQIIFYIISGMLLFSALLTVTSLKFFRAAVYLLATLVLTAGIYFMMAFNFIAIVQIVIYVGGIVVLILFSILLTSTPGAKVSKPGWIQVSSGLLVSVCGFALTAFIISGFAFKIISSGAENVKAITIGNQLMNVNESGYLLPFELITLLLLVAMISSITIAVIEHKEAPKPEKEALTDTLDKILIEINTAYNHDETTTGEIGSEPALKK